MQSLESVILFLIDQTSKAAKHKTQQVFDAMDLGITVDQWVLLVLIGENDGLSQKELAEKSIRDGASITRTLDILEKKNLVQRISLPDNRRQHSISLTNVGDAFINKNMKLVNEQRSQSIKGFTKKEIELLKSMLLKIQQNVT